MTKKSSIHENYDFMEVTMTNGTKVTMKSTCDKKALTLTIDKYTHPAWTKKVGFVNAKVSQIAKFQERFGNLGIK